MIAVIEAISYKVLSFIYIYIYFYIYLLHLSIFFRNTVSKRSVFLYWPSISLRNNSRSSRDKADSFFYSCRGLFLEGFCVHSLNISAFFQTRYCGTATVVSILAISIHISFMGFKDNKGQYGFWSKWFTYKIWEVSSRKGYVSLRSLALPSCPSRAIRRR